MRRGVHGRIIGVDAQLEARAVPAGVVVGVASSVAELLARAEAVDEGYLQDQLKVRTS